MRLQWFREDVNSTGRLPTGNFVIKDSEYQSALALATGVALVGADGAAGSTVALGGEDPASRGVADIDGTVRAWDTVPVSAAPLTRAAGERGGGQEADGDEEFGEVHFGFDAVKNLNFFLRRRVSGCEGWVDG